MSVSYDRRLMDATVDDLVHESRRIIDDLQVTLDIGSKGHHRAAIRVLCALNAELLRRLRELEAV